jgi:hypothetical protein
MLARILGRLQPLKREAPISGPTVTQLTEDPFGTDEDSDYDIEALQGIIDFHPTLFGFDYRFWCFQ